jgi:hypothetical protein
MSKIAINPNDPIGTINPNIYGHFAEHLGWCIYGGVWVGEDSPIPNTGGIRNDVVAALKKLKPAVIRWPGGCFADDYHWQDGVGPARAASAARQHPLGEVVESNAFGSRNSSASAGWSARSRTSSATSAPARCASCASGWSTATSPATAPWRSSAPPTAARSRST